MKVFEIFCSIQGEGSHQGYPCTFIRLAGCNLACTWCDTPHARTGGTEMNLGEIARRIGEVPSHYICITGGEPLLQGDQLPPLLSYLQERGYSIDIETNGTVDFRPFQPYASICMDVKCPSSGMTSDLSLLCHISEKDSVKFVVGDREDCDYAAAVIQNHPVKGEIFFSPVFSSDYRQIANYIVTKDLRIRLQLQLHKIIGVQ
ncbi:MAG: radical SAM protein [Methanoregulaceae archaeon]|nr:radical SAM protein [Methanoregulaceae archaeon]